MWVSALYLSKLTTRIEYRGDKDKLKEKGYIFCNWHEGVQVGAYAIPYKNIGLLFHPKYYMIVVYYVFYIFGTRSYIFGSTGNKGKEAADELQKLLSAKEVSTIINPDGPNGPRRKCKKGIFLYPSVLEHLSFQLELLLKRK